MGILYSRSVGVLFSDGDYIFSLDHDDLFLDEDVFKTIYNIAYESNIDIVEFKGIFQVFNEKNILNESTINDTKYQEHFPNLVLFQPELGNFPLKEGNSTDAMFNDVYLWSKCIKSILYREAISKLGQKRIRSYVLIFEDIYINYVLFNIANSFKFVSRYGLFRIKREESASKIWGSYKELNKAILFLVDIVIEFSKNLIENKKIIIILVIHLLNRYNINETINLKDKYKHLFISFLNKILCSNFFSSSSKKKIKILVKEKLFSINYSFHKKNCLYYYF